MDNSAIQVWLRWLKDTGEEQGIDLAERYLGMTFVDEESKADKFTIKVDNFDLTLLKSEVWQKGNIFEVSWGYPENMGIPRQIVVMKAKGFQTLTIEGNAKSVLMDREVHNSIFRRMRRSDIAKKLSEEYGYLDADIEDTEETFDSITQSRETDAAFLTRLAALEGFQFYVDHSGFHFHQRRLDKTPIREYTYYNGEGDFLSFEPEGNLFRRVGATTVKGRDPLDKKSFEETGGNKETDRSGNAALIEVISPEDLTTALQERTASKNVTPSSATTAAQAKRIADARYKLAEQAAVKAKARFIGDPGLLAKESIILNGLDIYSGVYYIKKVTHDAKGDYICTAELRRTGTDIAGYKAEKSEADQNKGGVKKGLQPVEKINPEDQSTSTIWK